MEHKMVTIPFDLETAKKIRKGERLGQIVAEKGRNRAEIVYEDNLCNEYPLLVVIHSIPVLADWFSSTGKAFNDANLERRLLKHALANVILSIISVAAIIALFTLIQN